MHKARSGSAIRRGACAIAHNGGKGSQRVKRFKGESKCARRGKKKNRKKKLSKQQQEGWRIADFFSHHPESMHMFTFLLDDVGIPLNYRHMEGFGVHTYTLMTRDGKV